jgi:predicted TIM-barrel fold metal-dependent hydrolase
VLVVSLTAPGIEGIFDPAEAAKTATKVNDQMHKLYRTGAHSHRFRTWGCVAMQDPQAAAKEAERCVKELGCVGILINGFSNVGNPDALEIQYLDEPQCEPFWAKLAELDVPLYLHPRIVAPVQTRIFRGYEFLAGSPWGFGRETAEHALRLMLSGLFDRYPNLRIVLGHCGEGLPFGIARADLRLRHFRKGEHGTHQRELCYYFPKNFWITTAGVQKQSVLESTIREVGIDRVMFSSDYPYEDMIETAQWFDALEIDDHTRAKLAYGNASNYTNRVERAGSRKHTPFHISPRLLAAPMPWPSTPRL